MDKRIIYSTDFYTISDSSLKGYCIHLVCLNGEASFTYNKHDFAVHKNDALVVSHPEDVVINNVSADLNVMVVAAPAKYLYSLLPSVNYGVSGRISLYDNPVIPLSEEHARQLLKDFDNLIERIPDTGNTFYSEVIGSLAVTMIYDIYYFHSLIHDTQTTTDRKAYVVKELISKLENGTSLQHREVAYYAERLNVTPKYLTETIKKSDWQQCYFPYRPLHNTYTEGNAQQSRPVHIANSRTYVFLVAVLFQPVRHETPRNVSGKVQSNTGCTK